MNWPSILSIMVYINTKYLVLNICYFITRDCKTQKFHHTVQERSFLFSYVSDAQKWHSLLET
ncbi:hypothetical protein V1477_004400 [Vespula maculifrons]|uniref:Uncharacterized protein n=1 Tax=Vespula maculifrons TaxID=7453 RepID=A0ABD2CU53_VESMC